MRPLSPASSLVFPQQTVATMEAASTTTATAPSNTPNPPKGKKGRSEEEEEEEVGLSILELSDPEWGESAFP